MTRIRWAVHCVLQLSLRWASLGAVLGLGLAIRTVLNFERLDLDNHVLPLIVLAIGQIIVRITLATVAVVAVGAIYEFFHGLVTYRPVCDSAIFPITHHAVMQAVLKCSDILMMRQPDHQLALRILRPFQGCVGFEEVSCNQSDATMACLCVTIADCYRVAGEYEKAALEYQRTAKYRPGLGADWYANMVLQHGMQGHFRFAFYALESAEAAWKRTPLADRLCGYLQSLFMCWRSGRLWLPKEFRQRKRLISDLRALLSEPDALFQGEGGGTAELGN